MSASSPSKQPNGFFPFIVGYSEEFLVGLVDGVISSVGMVVHETVPASTSRQRQSERSADLECGFLLKAIAEPHSPVCV
jgi:hypothetical protein